MKSTFALCATLVLSTSVILAAPAAENDLAVRMSDFDFPPSNLVPSIEKGLEEKKPHHKESRQAEEVVVAAVEAVVDIAKSIIDGINQDKEDRSKFTSETVSQMHQKNPGFNYVMCHTDHDKKFDGQEGKDWSHTHQEFDVQVGGTIGYEIYAFKAGSFTLKGDGGYLNWAFTGNVKSDDGSTQPGKTPRTVIFNAP